MQPSQFKEMSRNGQTVLQMRPAWSSYWRSGLAAMGVVVFWMTQRALFDELTLGLGIPAELAKIGLVLGLLPIALRVLYHRYTHAYEIENGRKIRTVAGFISRDKREFPLTDKVQTDMEQSVSGRLLNYGMIGFWTGDDRSRLEWRNAPDPDRIIAYLDKMKFDTQKGVQEDGSIFSHQTSAVEAPTLKEAKSTKYTHFGRAADYKQLSDRVVKRIITPFGEYLDNDDGTVSNKESGLMWLCAPWGMIWNGAGFVGSPIKLQWNQAVTLFGRGRSVGYGVGRKLAYFCPEKRAASSFDNGYKTGKCMVHAAGYKDWRLPTAAELDRIVSYAHRRSLEPGEALSELSEDEQYDWGWGGEANQAVRERLYPKLFTPSHLHLWTATGLGGSLAWAYDGSLPVGDFNVTEGRSVMFVRRLTGGELLPPKIENEEVVW